VARSDVHLHGWQDEYRHLQGAVSCNSLGDEFFFANTIVDVDILSAFLGNR
jgi:hypothetical protein